jgi:hypothetical protein
LGAHDPAGSVVVVVGTVVVVVGTVVVVVVATVVVVVGTVDVVVVGTVVVVATVVVVLGTVVVVVAVVVVVGGGRFLLALSKMWAWQRANPGGAGPQTGRSDRALSAGRPGFWGAATDTRATNKAVTTTATRATRRRRRGIRR